MDFFLLWEQINTINASAISATYLAEMTFS